MATRVNGLTSGSAPSVGGAAEQGIDLGVLQQTDREAARLGWQMNDAGAGGVDLDGRPDFLTWIEFLEGGPRLFSGPLILNTERALLRLQALFALPVGPVGGVPQIPADRSGLYKLGRANAIDGVATGWEGQEALVFESFDPTFSSGRLYFSSGASAPRELSLTPAAFTASPSGVLLEGRAYLYFAAAGSLSTPAALYRVSVDDPSGRLERVSVPEVGSLLSWPRFHLTPEGRVAVAFRDSQSRPRFALSEDGLTFGHPVQVGPPGAMAAAASFSEGGFAFTFQRGTGAMQSVVVTSPDGIRWSPTRPVSQLSGNVHDTSMIAREDGGIDLYYALTPSGEGFRLFRRALMPDGRLGPEQTLTTSEEGALTKPGVFRGPRGERIVTFAEIVARAPTGEPTLQRAGRFSLTSDAPAA